MPPQSTTRRLDWRAILARAPLPMLALAASYGVFSFARIFVPEWVAWVQAAAFESAYIGLAVTRGLDDGQRRRATLISIGAVLTSVIYNTLAGWFHAEPQVIADASAIAWLCLALLHGAPLAWVAYLVSDLLLHADAPMPVPDAVYARPDAIPEPATYAPPMRAYACPKCAHALSSAQYAAARRWGRCTACKPVK
jgi:hypothetical protein